MKKLLIALLSFFVFVSYTTSANALIPRTKIVTASWYDCNKKGECSPSKRTASCSKFNPNGLTAAHKYLRMGTRVEVTNIKTGKSIIVTINDRGPFIKGRELDLSKGAARKLGIINSGTAKVRMRVLN